MDLNDSFTEKLLQRSKARKEYLAVKKGESPNITSKKRPVLFEEQHTTNQDIEESVTDDSPKRQRLSLPYEDAEYEKENIDMEDIVEEESFVPFKASSNRGLAALKNKHATDSTNDETVSNGSKSDVEVNNCRSYVFSTNSSELCSTRKTRLANLAANINQWEDNLQSTHTTNNVTSSVLKKPQNFPSTSNFTSASKPFDAKMQQHNVSNALPRTSKLQGTFNAAAGGFVIEKSELSYPRMPPVLKGNIEGSGDSSKKIKRLGAWDQAVKAALESDEIVKSPLKTSANNLKGKELERESSDEELEEEETDNVDKNYQSKIDKFPKNQYDNVTKNEVLDKSFDPAELPLSARKALFEKAITGGNKQPSLPPEKLSVAQRAALFETASKTNSKPKFPSNFAGQRGFGNQNTSPIATVKADAFPLSPNKNITASPSSDKIAISKAKVAAGSPLKKVSAPADSPLSPSKNVGGHTRLVQQQLVKSIAATNWQQKDIAAKAAGERKAEISNLVNHWEKLSSSSSAENRNSEEEPIQQPQKSDEVFESEEEEADYESDIESEYTEREYDSEWNDKPEIRNCNDQSQFDLEASDSEEEVFNPKRFSAEAGLSNFDVETDCTTDNDTMSYTEPHRAYNNNYNSASSESLSSKSSTSEPNSYSVSKSQSGSSCGSTSSNRQTSNDRETEVKTSVTSSDSPLCHTVSFYRKQKQVTRTPPLQTIVRREPIMEVPEEDGQAEVIQERIKLLQEDILRQQTVISQTSQALNLCHATAEFSGSTEQVEGERLLLIATQKRQACLNEIQRLKSHGAQGQYIADGSGTLTISDIHLPLKRDFISAQLEGKMNDTIHCFLCLIRHGPQVIVTQMVSTNDKISDGALCFTNHIKLQNLPPDFSVVFEVYALQTKKEVLPHEKKYHIKKDSSKVRHNSKGKKGDGKLLFPGISSPGGPNAVRSPSFSVIGFTRFTIQNHNKKCFTLDKVPFTSPLDGVVKVKLHLHAEHKVMEKGFLTMFEDVSGFGAWHRRWCSLDSHHLAYWKYPDDETKKEPIGIIDLKQCVTSYVKLVPRDICARPNTFQLLIVRPHTKGDKNTLISQSVDTLTSTKHLISADTKEERVTWCNKLNEALTNLRKWDPRALRPIEDKQE